MRRKIYILKIIGENVSRVRKEKKLSQENLAHLADIDRTYIGYIENAKYNVTITKLQQIAEALGISITELTSEYISKPEQIEIASPQNLVSKINSLIPGIREYQKLADEHGITIYFKTTEENYYKSC